MPAVFSRVSASPSSTGGLAMQTSATASSEAWDVQALPISDKDVLNRAASTIDLNTAGDASGGSPLGGSRSNASGATNPQPEERESSHPSSSSTVSGDGRRVSAHATEVLDSPPPHAATPPTVTTTDATTEPWIFGILDEDALDAAEKGCGSDDLTARKAKHAAERRFPQSSLWTPPAQFVPPVDEFWMPDALDAAVNKIAPLEKVCGSDDLAARKGKHAAERRFPQRSLWTPPAQFVPAVDEFWMPQSSSMKEWPTVSSPPHLAAPVLVQSEEDDDDSDKENQAPVQNIGTFVPARRQASRHFTHRRVLSALTAGSNSTRTYLDASTTVASPSVFPFAVLKEKVLVYERSDVDGF
ncbi:hypothetical protein R3P38DRAFT_3252047 [Favolaschia claudopus]|uniref:Uncharacterized protein n=1 Tax=Favolaschia claudopus TaxID=2862362 RepID=A0AAW0E457_9AGAR